MYVIFKYSFALAFRGCAFASKEKCKKVEKNVFLSESFAALSFQFVLALLVCMLFACFFF
jgi:hypothetical protein